MPEDMAVMGAGHTNLTQRGESAASKVMLPGFGGEGSQWLTLSLLSRLYKLHPYIMKYQLFNWKFHSCDRNSIIGFHTVMKCYLKVRL